MIVRAARYTALALAIGVPSFLLVRRLAPGSAPDPATAAQAAADPADCVRGEARRAAPQVARALAALRNAAAAPPAVPLAPRSDLDDLRQRTPAANGIHSALTREVSRVGAPCLVSGQPASLVDLRFQVRATAEELVARGPIITVQQGAPLAPELQTCLEQRLAGPLVARAEPGSPFPPFEGEARIEVSYE